MNRPRIRDRVAKHISMRKEDPSLKVINRFEGIKLGGLQAVLSLLPLSILGVRCPC